MLFKKPPHDAPDLNPRSSRRHQRAEALRRQALSPVRILVMVLLLPLTTVLIATGVFLRLSEYEREEAVIHLIALAGCDATQAIGVGPFYEGQAGYHKRNDPDGDGIACGVANAPRVNVPQVQNSPEPQQRSLGTAKFVRP
ncbi:excalibur calcium-binding domain-containing protein [uncultured Ruegeria sp.]|uniref:excalibur calcium-binding domain-containing protein n=1 Tax=uncultured Ruegeria sp. TaxID=259304 RepID=UPI0026190D4B|nr:excalibur calcium-binding domain-containing protein [uncultured Ruegeria sp.]